MKSLVACLVVLSSLSAFADPRVDIVIGDKAPALERLAADELSSQLKRVYEADVKISSIVSADASQVIFVGSPETNVSMKPFANSWPSGDKKLTAQGHVLRSVTHQNRPALLIGGGSPVATYWAVAEFGHRLGIRAMLFGDLPPVTPPSLKLDGFDNVIEPTVKSREWRFANLTAWDSGAWGLDEYRSVLKQLAKLKFNRVSVAVGASQPFVHFEYGGVTRQTGVMWGGRIYSVTGDTSGRNAFGGAKLFENPSFSGTTTYAERVAAGQKLLRGVIDAAHELGITVGLSPPVVEFPKEFAATIPDDEPFRDQVGLSGFPNLKNLGRDPRLTGLFQAQWRAYLDTYPALDELDLVISVAEPELPAFRRLFDAKDMRRRVDGRVIDVRLHDKTDDVVISRLLTPKQDVASGRLHLSLNSQVNVLPFLRHSTLPQQFAELSSLKCDGFVAHGDAIGDLDLSVYWLSRASFGEALSLEDSCRDLLAPVCDGKVDDRVTKAFVLIERATQLIDANDTPLGIPTYGFVDRDAEPPPEWWGELRDCYLNAMNEMYRANTRAREGGRDFTLYLARRFEFAFEYMNCIEAVRKAGIAERKKDTTAQIAELEKAIESLNNALNAMAAVARSNSDRGLIAVLNENGYRPLKKKLAEAEATAK